MVKFVDTIIDLITDNFTNCTNKKNEPPTANTFLGDIQPAYVLALILCTAIFLGTLALFVVHLTFIARYCNDFYKRALVLFLAGTPVFISFFALVAIFMPRTWFLAYLLSFFYFSLAIYFTVCLLLQLLDGPHSLVKKMNQSANNMIVQTPPFCCFMFCLPELPIHIKKIRWCEMIVMQTPVVRLVCTVISLILYFEYSDKSFVALKVIDFISLPSLLLGIYGMHVLSNTVAKLDEISNSRYIVIFRIVDFYFMVFGLQTPLFEISARAGLFECGHGTLNSLDTAYWWKNVAIIIESFVISIISSLLLRPSRTGLFDKYNASCRSVGSMSTSISVAESAA